MAVYISPAMTTLEIGHRAVAIAQFSEHWYHRSINTGSR